MHWLTPVPGLGAGACSFKIPKEWIDAFDMDGDGEFNLRDVQVRGVRQSGGCMQAPLPSFSIK